MVAKWRETKYCIFAIQPFSSVRRGPQVLPHRIQRPTRPQSNCISRSQRFHETLESKTQEQTLRPLAVLLQEELLRLLGSDTHSTNQRSSLPIDGYYPARARMRFESKVPLASLIQRTYSRSPSSSASPKIFELSAVQKRGEPIGIVPEKRSCPR